MRALLLSFSALNADAAGRNHRAAKHFQEWPHASAHTDPVGPHLPWGIHLAYGSDPTTSMSVMWSTRQQVAGSVVNVGTSSSSFPLVFTGSQTNFSDVGNTQFIHKVLMSSLQPGTRYYYKVSDGQGNASQTFTFNTFPSAQQQPNKEVTLTVIGDMGILDPNSHLTIPLLIDDAQSGAIGDALLHVGDIAYDLPDNNGLNGDQFVTTTQPYAAVTPVHYCPGNHENAEDFLQYRSRFDQMPPVTNSTGSVPVNSMYHTFSLGEGTPAGTKIIMFSSEAYFYFSEHGLPMLAQQYQWLENELANVDRSKTPWVITAAHRPAYCSPNDDEDDCHAPPGESIIRDGIAGQFGIDDLLYKYGVDVHFGAHEHSYERLYPVHKFQWSNQTGPGAYVNPGATVQILNGAAGCPENTDPWQNVSLPFSAYRIAAYGYGRITIHNATHATWSFIEDLIGNVIDSIDIVQNNHGPFALTASGKKFKPSSDPLIVQKAYEEAQQHIERQKKQVMMEVAAKKQQAGSSKKKTNNKHKARLGGGGRHKKAE